MITRKEKSELSIEELRNLVESVEDKNASDFYAYKLFMILVYLKRFDEALNVSGAIENSKIRDVIKIYKKFLESDYDRLTQDSYDVEKLDIDVIRNHHEYTVLYIRAMSLYEKEDYISAARILYDVIKNCQIDEILVEVAIVDFVSICDKSNNKELFNEFYNDYYKSNASNFTNTAVRLIEVSYEKLKHLTSEVDEIVKKYSKYSENNVTFREYFYASCNEFASSVNFDLAYIVIFSGETIATYKYTNNAVSRYFASIKDIGDTIYENMLSTKKPLLKNLGNDMNIKNIVFDEEIDVESGSFISTPIICDGKMIAAFTLYSDSTNIPKEYELVEHFVSILRMKIIDKLEKYTAKFNDQVVEALDCLVVGYLIETNGMIKFSKGSQKAFGIHSEQLPLRLLISEITEESVSKLDSLIKRNLDRDTIEIVNKSNKIFLLEVQKIKLQNNESARFILVSDLTSAKNKLNRFENMAYVDTLTGLGNYNSLMSTFNNIKKDSIISFINFDINKFKEINDTYGHDIGDLALKFFANSLTLVFSKLNAKVFRKSGDEFIVILNDSVYSEQKIEALNELKTYLEDLRNYPQNLNTEIKFSAGIASTRSTKRTKDILFKCADLAMYESKQYNETSSYVIFDEERLKEYEEAKEKVKYVKKVLKDLEFELTYREIYDIEKRVRCYKTRPGIPELNLIGNELIKFAASNDLQFDLDVAICKKIFKEQKTFMDKAKCEKNMHIPIDAKSILKDSFYELLTSIIEEYNITRSTVTFSIVDLDNTNNYDEVAEKLNRYLKFGINLSFDFTNTKFPNTNYFNDVNFKYFNMPTEMVSVFGDNKVNRKQIHLIFIFQALKELNTTPIIEDIDIELEYDELINNNINFFIKKDAEHKYLDEIIDDFNAGRVWIVNPCGSS